MSPGQFSDAEDGGVTAVGGTGQPVVESCDELGGGRDDIVGLVGAGGMASLTFDGDVDLIAVGSESAIANADFARVSRFTAVNGNLVVGDLASEQPFISIPNPSTVNRPGPDGS